MGSISTGLVCKELGGILMSGRSRVIVWDDGSTVMPYSETEVGDNRREGTT